MLDVSGAYWSSGCLGCARNNCRSELMRKKRKFFWVIEGFDLIQWSLFNPDPGLFETEEEACAYCKLTESRSIKYTYRKIRLGKIPH